MSRQRRVPPIPMTSGRRRSRCRRSSRRFAENSAAPHDATAASALLAAVSAFIQTDESQTEEGRGAPGRLGEGLRHATAGAAAAGDAGERDLRACRGTATGRRRAVVVQAVGRVDRDVAVTEVLEVDVGVAGVTELELVLELVRV